MSNVQLHLLELGVVGGVAWAAVRVVEWLRSLLSRECPACQGSGMIEIQYEMDPCPNCKQRGRISL
jgi:DnaJ-class molecular chaperone